MSGAKSGMCLAALGDIFIGCDGCNSRYHPTHVCLGLPDSIINIIKEYSSKGINFCCTSCRLEERISSNGPQSGRIVDGSNGLDSGIREEAVKQLFETVQRLCAAVATSTKNMKQMMKNVGQLNANPLNPTESEVIRLAIIEEVKEMEEREKKKTSIVVKGLEVPSGTEFVEVFENVWKYLL